jgi:hypothetical protein
LRLRSPAQLRIDAATLTPAKAANPELLAPFARAVHNALCPVCQARVVGVEDAGPDGPRVQVTCFGDPAHVFFFSTGTGHVADRPDAYGEVPEGAGVAEA